MEVGTPTPCFDKIPTFSRFFWTTSHRPVCHFNFKDISILKTPINALHILLHNVFHTFRPHLFASYCMVFDMNLFEIFSICNNFLVEFESFLKKSTSLWYQERLLLSFFLFILFFFPFPLPLYLSLYCREKSGNFASRSSINCICREYRKI